MPSARAGRSRWSRRADGEHGGYKEIIAEISGAGVFGRLKFESGVHRVQRVPATEAQGRIHTSTATVAMLPEPEEVNIEINRSDLRIDTYRASGAGGQHVNKTDSAIRITHLPTGIVVDSPGRALAAQEPRQGDGAAARRLYEPSASRRQRARADRAQARSAPATARSASAPTTSRKAG